MSTVKPACVKPLYRVNNYIFFEQGMIETFILTLVIILFFSVSLILRGMLRGAALPGPPEDDPVDRPFNCPSCGTGVLNACDGCRKVRDR